MRHRFPFPSTLVLDLLHRVFVPRNPIVLSFGLFYFACALIVLAVPMPLVALSYLPCYASLLPHRLFSLTIRLT